jgi:hypothetical protein
VRGLVGRAAETKGEKTPSGEAPIQNSYTFWYIKRNTGNKAVTVRPIQCRRPAETFLIAQL